MTDINLGYLLQETGDKLLLEDGGGLLLDELLSDNLNISESVSIKIFENRYWVGGTGIWNSSSTTHWSLTSGGASGASVPTPSQNAIFDSSSGAGTVSISGARVCYDFISLGYTGTISPDSGGGTLYIYGDITCGAGMTWGDDNILILNSSTLGKTITTNGVSMPRANLGSVYTGGYTLLDDWTEKTTGTKFGIAFDGGYLNVNGKTITSASFDFSFAGTKTLDLTNSALKKVGTGNFSITSSNLTLISNNSTILINGTGSLISISAGGIVLNNVELNETCSVNGVFTYNDLKIAAGKTVTFEAGDTQTMSSFSPTGTEGNLVTIQSSSAGSPFTFSKSSGTVNASYLSIKDSTATGGAIWNAYSSIDVSGNTGWNFIYIVNVNDNLNISEFSSRACEIEGINTFDQLNISNPITGINNNLVGINKFDQLNISNPITGIDNNLVGINKFDQLNISSPITGITNTQLGNINKFDQLNISNPITGITNTQLGNINKFDQINISTEPILSFGLFSLQYLNISEYITVSMSQLEDINKFDQLNISEFKAVEVVSFINKFDQLNINSPLTNINNNLANISETDSLNLIENFGSNGWLYKVKITIDHTKVAADQVDFPIYIDLSTLPTHFFTNVKVDGSDIRVFKYDNNTELPYELVAIDTATKTGELHFKGDISSVYDTEFYIRYGNASATAYLSTDTYGRNNVWTDYVGVWHLGESGSTKYDSTGNSNGTVTGTVTSIDGKKGKASHFSSAINSNIFIPDPAGLTNLDTQDNYSVSFWAKRWDSTTLLDRSASEHWESATGLNPYPWAIRGFTSAAALSMAIYNGGATAPSGIVYNPGCPSTGAVMENVWKLVTFVKDYSAKKLKTYVDAVITGGSGNTFTVPDIDSTKSQNNGFVIGERTSTGTTRTPNIDIQEFRIIKSITSDGYRITESNNQSSPATFYSVSYTNTIEIPNLGDISAVDNVKVFENRTNFPFYNQPSFVAETNTYDRWIDGTASGSTTDSTYGWGFTKTTSGTGTARFTTVDGVDCIKATITGLSKAGAVVGQIGISNIRDYSGGTVSSYNTPFMIPVIEGRVYTLIGNYYIHSCSDTTNVATNAKVVWYAADGITRISSSGTNQKYGTTLNMWLPITGSTFAAPVGARYLAIGQAALAVNSDGVGRDMTVSWSEMNVYSSGVNLEEISFISSYDLLNLSENFNQTKIFNLSTYDNINIADQVYMSLINNISTQESITLTEKIGMESFRFSPSPGGSQPKGALSTMRPIASFSNLAPIGSIDNNQRQQPQGSGRGNQQPIGGKGLSM